MRVIGGRLGGRHLAAPEGEGTRPTSDRVREALFSILGPPTPHTRVLDLFAGSGALGIEALSRGASFAQFVDHSRHALRCLVSNLGALGLEAESQIVNRDAIRALADLEDRGAPAFDWVFLDPSYAGDACARALVALGSGRLLTDRGVVVAEHDRRRPLDPTYGALALTDQRRYGDTAVSFFRRGERDA